MAAVELDDELDYSSPAWRFATVLNDYFAGWEEVDEALSDEDYAEFVEFVIKSADKACQTPAEWLVLKPTERPKEDERSRAERQVRVPKHGRIDPRSTICTGARLL